MTAAAAVLLAALLLENDDFGREVLNQDGADHLGVGHGGRADGHGTVALDEQHLRQLDGVAGLAFEPLHAHGVAWGYAVLLATRCEHGVHEDPLGEGKRDDYCSNWRGPGQAALTRTLAWGPATHAERPRSCSASGRRCGPAAATERRESLPTGTAAERRPRGGTAGLA